MLLYYLCECLNKDLPVSYNISQHWLVDRLINAIFTWTIIPCEKNLLINWASEWCVKQKLSSLNCSPFSDSIRQWVLNWVNQVTVLFDVNTHYHAIKWIDIDTNQMSLVYRLDVLFFDSFVNYRGRNGEDFLLPASSRPVSSFYFSSPPRFAPPKVVPAPIPRPVSVSGQLLSKLKIMTLDKEERSFI
jgi:hypothetical protein